MYTQNNFQNLYPTLTLCFDESCSLLLQLQASTFLGPIYHLRFLSIFPFYIKPCTSPRLLTRFSHIKLKVFVFAPRQLITTKLVWPDFTYASSAYFSKFREAASFIFAEETLSTNSAPICLTQIYNLLSKFLSVSKFHFNKNLSRSMKKKPTYSYCTHPHVNTIVNFFQHIILISQLRYVSNGFKTRLLL